MYNCRSCYICVDPLNEVHGHLPGSGRLDLFEKPHMQLGHTIIKMHTSFSAIPGVPQMISAVEIVQPRDNICIILVTWDPPANSDDSDVDQYRVYVPSRNIRNDISSSTISTLTLTNCGDDILIQVAAVNRVGCVGMNSSEVQLTLLDIPSPPTDDGSTTTEGGSAQTSSKWKKKMNHYIIVYVCVYSWIRVVYFAFLED